jgi:hypothetical protein
MLPLECFVALAAVVVTVVDPLARRAATWIMLAISFRYRVEAEWAARAAAPEAAQGQGQAPPRPVAVHRFKGIVGTGRGEPAGGYPSHSGHLVDPDQEHQESSWGGGPGLARQTTSICHDP